MGARTAGDWPVDPDGEQGSNGMRRFDMAILSKFEPKSAFPMTTGDYLDRHASKPVRINHETIVSVETIFEHVDPDSFETKSEFHAAVGNALRKGDMWDFHPRA